MGVCVSALLSKVSSLLVMDIPIVKVTCEFSYVIEFAETISGTVVSYYILLKQRGCHTGL